MLLAPARIELLRPTPTRAVIVAALILAAAVPLVNEGQYLFVACTVAIYVLAAIGMNVLHGYAGQISLGQGAMVAIGAYTTGILTVKEGWTFWPTVGVAIAVAIAIGVVMSLPALRMGSWYLAMVTLIMASLVQEFLLEAEGLTNGGAGIIGIPQVPGFDPSEPLSLTQLYYLMIGVIVALTWLCWNLSRSPFGRALLAVKESEVGAQAIGIGIARSKIFAYVVSAITGAIAGSFWAGLNGVVTPDEFDISLSVFILLAVLLGGEGRLASPVLGSILLFALPQLMTGLAQWRLLVYGLLLLVLALFAPFGLTGLAVSAWDRIRGVRRRPQRVVPAWVASEGEAGPGTHLSAILGSAGGNGTGAYELDVCDVSVSFGGNHAVVRASMHVPGGTIHGLIGPNGSGKTTMLNLISGYYPLKEGRITIAGVDASRRRATVIARQGVARTFQHPRLMDQETVLTNVLMGAFRLNQATLAEWLLRVGRSRQEERRNRADAMECLAFTRLDHLSEVRVNQLAHGQRRLVEVARALASRPRLLLLDEPAAGLPPDQVDRLSTLITEIRALDITVLIVEHHIEMVANLVDSVTVMNQGRVLADGPVREVIESPAVLAAYIGKIDALPNRTGSERSLR